MWAATVAQRGRVSPFWLLVWQGFRREAVRDGEVAKVPGLECLLSMHKARVPCPTERLRLTLWWCSPGSGLFLTTSGLRNNFAMVLLW